MVDVGCVYNFHCATEGIFTLHITNIGYLSETIYSNACRLIIIETVIAHNRFCKFANDV
jgi:hypothetical protein